MKVDLCSVHNFPKPENGIFPLFQKFKNFRMQQNDFQVHSLFRIYY